MTLRLGDGDSPVIVRKSLGAAPSGISPVKAALLRQGKQVKVVAKQTGLPLAASTTRLAIRIATGALRSCALFTDFKKNEPGRIIAVNAPAPAIRRLLGCQPPRCDAELRQ